MRLRTVDFDNVFNDPSADGTAGMELLLQFKTTGVAQAHMSTGIDHYIHLIIKANCAFPVLAA